MKIATLTSLLLCMMINSGCTTLHPTDASTDEVQRLIVFEGLLEPGDKVRLVTTDDAVHEFRVTEINLDEGLVSGKNDSVRIAEIVGVGTRDFAVGKTVGTTLGISSGVIVALFLAAGAE